MIISTLGLTSFPVIMATRVITVIKASPPATFLLRLKGNFPNMIKSTAKSAHKKYIRWKCTICKCITNKKEL